MKEKDLHPTSLFNFGNLFNVHTDQNGNNFFNLSNNIIFETDPDVTLYVEYTPTSGDEWASISHKFYKTPELWWLICRFNQVTNGLSKPSDYPVLRIPTKDFATFIANKVKYNN